MLKRLLPFALVLFAFVGTQTVHAQTDEEQLGLADLIFAVRGELIKAAEMMKEAGHAPLFVTKRLDLELSFVVERSVSGGAGFNIRIITLGATGDYSASNTQKIRLQLETPTPPIKPISYLEWPGFLNTYGVEGGTFDGLPEGVPDWLRGEGGRKFWNSMRGIGGSSLVLPTPPN